jgi:hypothetical protein
MTLAGLQDPATAPRPVRLALLGLAGAAMLAGLTGALVLIGTPVPAEVVALAARHGILMTLGFLGTLIALERAVALGRPWGYLAPLVSGLGGVAIVAGVPATTAAVALTIGGLVLVAIYVVFARIQPSLHLAVEAAGAGAWVVAATLVALGVTTSNVVPWLAAFLVLTVMGERLELSAVLRPSGRVRAAFVLAVELYVIGVTLTLVVPEIGARLAGLGLVAIAVWALRFDLARRTIRARGVTRFIAACLLLGYGWLVVAGTTWIVAGPVTAGPAYDAALHAVFLGFVISMVFGHAPVILPGVLRVPLPYHPAFYGHLALLHLGLAIRIVGGDLLSIPGAWRLGGTLSVLAMLLFIAVSVASVVGGSLRGSAPRAARSSPGAPS